MFHEKRAPHLEISFTNRAFSLRTVVQRGPFDDRPWRSISSNHLLPTIPTASKSTMRLLFFVGDEGPMDFHYLYTFLQNFDFK